MSTYHKLSAQVLKANWTWRFGKGDLPDERYFSALSNTLITDQQSENVYHALVVCAADMAFEDENLRMSWILEHLWSSINNDVSVVWKTKLQVIEDTEPAPAVCTAPRKPRLPRKRRIRVAGRK